MGGKRDEFGLTKKQREFADAYLADPERNALRAYASVYGKDNGGARASASISLTRPNIAAYIAERTKSAREEAEKKHRVTHDWLTEQYLKIARFDARKLFNEDGSLKRIVDLDDDTAYVISSVDVSITRLQGKSQDDIIEEVTRKVRMWDKGKALEALGRHLGYFDADQSNAPKVFMVGFRRPKEEGNG